jgi:hypothetical protein
MRQADIYALPHGRATDLFVVDYLIKFMLTRLAYLISFTNRNSHSALIEN